jgi:hypothetical protein
MLMSSGYGRAVSIFLWQIPLIIVVLAFLRQIITAPYAMHQEDEAKREDERANEGGLREKLASDRDEREAKLKAVMDLRETRSKQQACLAELMEAGDALRCQIHGDPIQAAEWMRQYGDWADQVRLKVGQEFSAPLATKLFTLKTVLDAKRNFGGHGPHQNAHARVCAVMDELHKMFPMLPDGQVARSRE